MWALGCCAAADPKLEDLLPAMDAVCGHVVEATWQPPTLRDAVQLLHAASRLRYGNRRFSGFLLASLCPRIDELDEVQYTQTVTACARLDVQLPPTFRLYVASYYQRYARLMSQQGLAGATWALGVLGLLTSDDVSGSCRAQLARIAAGERQEWCEEQLQ